MVLATVVDTKKAFKPKQKDDQGNELALGSIEVRLGGYSTNLGTIRNVFARPAVFNRRIPLIGEHVYVMMAPTNDRLTDGVKGMGYIYFDPVNVTDDLVLHQMNFSWNRSQAKSATPKAKRKYDREEPGWTFPKKPKKVDNIQPFEGDVIFEGRFGQSVRFGSTVVGNLSIYDKKPTWKGTSNTDPIIIMRVKKPGGGVANTGGSGIGDKFKSNAKYTVEDMGDDDASIYIATTQLLTKFKAGFKKNLDVKVAPNWKGKSQIIVDAERVIINAQKDKAFLIGSKEAVVTGKKVLLQSDKYKVDLDTLMDWLKAWIDQDSYLAQGTKQYSTACGPTLTSTNVADYIKLQNVDWQKFKLP